MAASAHDVAKFYHTLLVSKTLLKPSSVAIMEDFHLLSYGWAAGHIQYGAGLMIEQPVSNGTSSGFAVPDFSKWGAYMGHGGDTYGFLSEQGIIGQLGNASFSVAANTDGDFEIATKTLACRVITAAAKTLKGITLDLHCTS